MYIYICGHQTASLAYWHLYCVGQFDCLSARETWGVPFMWLGTLKKIIDQGSNGPLLCDAWARKWLAIPWHPGSPTINNQGEIWSSWVPGAKLSGTMMNKDGTLHPRSMLALILANSEGIWNNYVDIQQKIMQVRFIIFLSTWGYNSNHAAQSLKENTSKYKLSWSDVKHVYTIPFN